MSFYVNKSGNNLRSYPTHKDQSSQTTRLFHTILEDTSAWMRTPNAQQPPPSAEPATLQEYCDHSQASPNGDEDTSAWMRTPNAQQPPPSAEPATPQHDCNHSQASTNGETSHNLTQAINHLVQFKTVNIEVLKAMQDNNINRIWMLAEISTQALLRARENILKAPVEEYTGDIQTHSGGNNNSNSNNVSAAAHSVDMNTRNANLEKDERKTLSGNGDNQLNHHFHLSLCSFVAITAITSVIMFVTGIAFIVASIDDDKNNNLSDPGIGLLICSAVTPVIFIIIYRIFSRGDVESSNLN